jgi:hypothetical protein
MIVSDRSKFRYAEAAHPASIAMKVVLTRLARSRAFFFGILVGLAIIGIVFTMT